MEDEKIIALYWDRDQTAIAETQQKYGRYCGSIAHNIVHDAQDAEECVNDTWMRAWNSMPRERPQASGGFSGSDHAQSVAGLLPQKALEKEAEVSCRIYMKNCMTAPGAREPLTQMERKELAASINRFLEGLDRESRIIFMRRYWYMDGIGAIAGRLAVSESKGKIFAVPVPGKTAETSGTRRAAFIAAERSGKYEDGRFTGCARRSGSLPTYRKRRTYAISEHAGSILCRWLPVWHFF